MVQFEEHPKIVDPSYAYTIEIEIQKVNNENY